MDNNIIEKDLFFQVEDEILKVKIGVDSTRLIELIDDICNNCSVIKHGEKRFYNEHFDFNNDRRYRNVKITVISKGYKDDVSHEDKPSIVDVSFEEYIFPVIVYDLINLAEGRFGGKNGFNISFKYETNEYDNILKQILDVQQRISEVSNDTTLSTSIKIKKLHTLSTRLAKLSQVDVKLPDKSITDYYDLILECFSICEVKTFSLETINSTLDFLTFIDKEELQSNIIDINKMDSIVIAWLMEEIGKINTQLKVKYLKND